MTETQYLRDRLHELEEEVELQRDVIVELREELDTANRDLIVLGQTIKYGKMEQMLP